MKVIRRISVILIALLTTAAHAQTKSPWQWSDDERLSARFDTASMKERAAPDVLVQYHFDEGRLRAARTAAASGKPVEVIIGARNPELFMPWELFDSLIAVAFGGSENSSAYMRNQYEQRALRLGLSLPNNFWKTLSELSRPYLSNKADISRLSKQYMNASAAERNDLAAALQSKRDATCRLRAEALTAARHHFGQTLDRFLYQIVAPDEVAWSTDPLPASQLISIEHGCN